MIRAIRYVFILSIVLLALSFAIPAFPLDGADKKLTVNRLDNGATVIVWEDHTNPIVTVDVWMKTGSLVETDETWGLAHYFEHMFYRGTDKRGPRQNRDEIIDIGGMTSAGTWYDYTHFYNTVSSDNLDLAIDTLTDSLMNLKLDDASVTTERSVISEEIKQRIDDPDIYPDEELQALVFADHRYGKRVIGSEDSIKNLTRANFVDYYKKYYSPENAIFVIAGDVKPSDAIAVVDSKTANWAKSGVTAKWDTPSSAPSGYTGTEEIGKYSGALVGIGFKTGGARHTDRHALEVAEYILLTSRNARLRMLMANGASSVYGGYSQYRDAGEFAIFASPKPTVGLEQVAAGVLNTLGEFASEGPTADEVNSAISELQMAIRFYQAGTQERARLLGEAAVYGNVDFYLNYADNLKKVTVSDVKRVANTYFVRENCKVIFFRPQPGAASNGRNEFDSALSALPAPQFSPDLSASVYPDAVTVRNGTGAPPAPAASDYKSSTLANGMKTIIVNLPGADVCSMGVFFPAGSAHDPQGRDGLTQLTLSLLEAGSASISREAAARAISELGNSYGSGADRDYSQVYVTTTIDKSASALDLLKKLCEKPLFDAKAFDDARGSQLAYLTGSSEDIVSVGLDSFKGAAFQGHPYAHSVFGTMESITSMTVDDVKVHWERMSNPKGAVFLFVGDASKAGLTGDLSGSLGTLLKGTGESFAPASAPAAETGLKGAYQVNLTRQQNMLVIGSRTNGVIDTAGTVSGDYAPLMVLGSLLSIRSFREIVYEKGLAYRSVGAYIPWKSGGVLMFYLGYSPSNEQAIYTAVNDQLTRVCTAPVSDDELTGVKGFINGYQVISLENPQDKLMRFGQWEMTGAGFDFLPKFMSGVESVTPAQVQSAAAACFSPASMLQMVVKG
jgi:zinc protease